jgi:hypothetical protein
VVECWAMVVVMVGPSAVPDRRRFHPKVPDHLKGALHQLDRMARVHPYHRTNSLALSILNREGCRPPLLSN